MSCLFDEFNIFLNGILLDILICYGLNPLEKLFRLIIHLLNQLTILLFLYLVKLPFILLHRNCFQILKISFNLRMNAVKVCLNELVLMLFLARSVLQVLVKSIQRLLTDSYLEVVPVIVFHEVLQLFATKQLWKLAQQSL